MNESAPFRSPPATILVATDLSPRCDRAVDRAAQLAERWNARVVVVHAIEGQPDLVETVRLPSWRRPPDPEQAAIEMLRAETARMPNAADFIARRGRAADIVLDAAERTQADLIVTGVARDEPFGRALLGDTVDRLMRTCHAPLLIARSRPHLFYRRIVVATDFSPSSRHALEVAAGCFPAAEFTLFNGYDVPFATYLTPAEIEAGLIRLETEVVQRFLDEADIPAGMKNHIERLVEHGAPERLLPELVIARGFDLTVVGTHGGGAIFDLLIGSTARKIIDSVPGDVLVARARQAG